MAAAADPVSAIAGAVGDIAQTFKSGFDIIRGRDLDFSARNYREITREQIWAGTNGQRLNYLQTNSKSQLITTITAVLFLLVISLVLIHKHR